MDGKRGQGGVVRNLGCICVALPLPESRGRPGTCTSTAFTWQEGRFAGHESARGHLVGG